MSVHPPAPQSTVSAFRRLSTLLALALCTVGAPGGHAQDRQSDDEGESTPTPTTTTDATPPVAEAPSLQTEMDAGLNREPVRPAPGAPLPIGLVVSGGVSLGSYEAGLLFYLTEWLKLNPDVARVHVATGASAGSSNSLWSLMALCSPRQLDPTQSLFWSWIDLGFDSIFVPEASTSLAVFDVKSAQPALDKMREHWDAGLSRQCDMLYGATVTRLHPSKLKVDGGALQLPRVEERFSARIRGYGQGRPAGARNFVPGIERSRHMLLPLDGSQADAPGTLSSLLTASSAFPMAFPPAPVPHCVSKGGQPATCTPAEAQTSLFVDGGLFDNTPVDLAVALSATGLKRGGQGKYSVRAQPNGDIEDVPPDFLYMVVSPTVTDFPRPESNTQENPKWMLPLVSHLASDFISTSRSRELVKLFDARPTVADQVAVTRSALPPISAHMASFFGFFERSFREFDFALGMYDARRYIDDVVLPRASTVPRHPRWVEEHADSNPDLTPYRNLACLRAVLAGVDAEQAQCRGKELADFRILLRTSLEVAQSRCETSAAALKDPDAQRTALAKCPAAARKTLLREFPGARTTPSPDWKQRPGEVDTDYILRRLAAHRFQFRDLGLSAEEADLAGVTIREHVGQMVQALAKAQDKGSVTRRATVLALGRIGANLLSYRPAKYSAHLTFGSPWELGLSGALPWPTSRAIRLSGALQLWGLRALASSGPKSFAFAPVLGPEFEPTAINGAFHQFRFGARAGYLFSREDKYSSRTCAPTDPKDLDHVCSRPLVHTYAAITFFDLLRIQLGATLLPRMRKRNDPFVFFIQPTIGLQLSFSP